MATTQKIFERHEKKYMLTPPVYNQLRQLLETHMKADKYGLHTISSIYYDTDNFQIVRASNAKPVYKEKLRVRCYGFPNEDSDIFLELKKKFDGVVHKRRIALPLHEARAYLDEGIPPDTAAMSKQEDQIFEEIDWLVSRYQPSGKIMLASDRIALFGKEDPELRITFDFKIRWRDYNLDLTEGSYGQNLISSRQCLMEIKTTYALPVWLTSMLSHMEIFPTSFSKYGTCYQTYLMDKGEMRHAG